MMFYFYKLKPYLCNAVSFNHLTILHLYLSPMNLILPWPYTETCYADTGNANISNSPAVVANFTFVARDSATGKAVPINQILPETEQEILLWEEAEQRNKLRKKKKAEEKHGESGDTARLSALLAEGRIFGDMPALADRDSILMKDTCLQNSFICQPQQRNIHGRIFGGFLMRRAFELAFSTAYAFAGAAPHFMEVDHVDFFKPVSIQPTKDTIYFNIQWTEFHAQEWC